MFVFVDLMLKVPTPATPLLTSLANALPSMLTRESVPPLLTLTALVAPIEPAFPAEPICKMPLLTVVAPL